MKTTSENAKRIPEKETSVLEEGDKEIRINRTAKNPRRTPKAGNEIA